MGRVPKLGPRHRNAGGGKGSLITPPTSPSRIHTHTHDRVHSYIPVSEERLLPVVPPPHPLVRRHYKVAREGLSVAAEVLLGEHAVRFRSDLPDRECRARSADMQ